MLEYLHIRDLALISDMELEFASGMNVLTGETGAGKSFILKALNFLMGERLGADMVRPGKERAQPCPSKETKGCDAGMGTEDPAPWASSGTTGHLP